MHIASSGSIARQVIDQHREMTVMGVTSRGIFVRADVDQVIFLSLEHYRGPLTLNLSGHSCDLAGIEPGDTVRVESQSLCFPKTNLQIRIGNAVEWQPASPALPALAEDEICSRVQIVSSQVLTEPSSFDERVVSNLRHGLMMGDSRAVTGAVEQVLGLGSGLTPSGDDLALGLLLTLNRWRSCFPADLPVERMNRGICQAAVMKTTTLSANLIACAAQGLADERLIQALDGLVTGEPSIDACAALLRGWGHHSGGDALVGMASALQECML